jgi:hypothetical protein
VTTSISDFMPADIVLKYGASSQAFYVWFFYDNFGTSDTITVKFTYLDDGTVVHIFTAQGGGDYGAASFTLEAPDAGWPTGNYRVEVSGKGVSETVDFEVINGATVSQPLPYEAGGQLVGNDRDSHGCIPSAGYAWCEAKQKCLRSWEEECAAAASEPATTAGMTSDSMILDTTGGYLGACQHTDTASWRLDKALQVSLLQAWYNWASGESSITYTLKKDGADFASGTMVRADCDPYQGNWCNGNYKIEKEFPPGNYELKVSSAKMCLEPGGTGAVRIYGKETGASASGACSIVGDWQWFNHAHVYLRADGTLDAWDNGAKAEWGSWKKNSDGSYTLSWNKGYVDELVLSSDCSSLSGNNQYAAGVSGTKLSGTVADAAAPALPSGVPVHLSNCNYAGTWSTDWGTMALAQDGSKVTGTYTHDSGKVAGTLVDGVYVGKWSEYPSYSEPGDAGDMVFYFTDDCGSFSGTWHYGVHTSGGWSGTWVGTKAS